MSPSSSDTSAHQLLKKGLVLLQKRQFDDAFNAFSNVVETFPLQGTAWLLRGISQAKLKRPQEAMSDLYKALEISPDDANIRMKAARTMVGLREAPRAIELLTPLMDAGNASVDVYELCFQLGLKLGRYRTAFRALDKALEGDPHHYSRRIDAARLLHNMRDYKLSLAHLDKVISLGGGNAEACYLRSDVLRDMDRIDEALDSVKQAVSSERENVESFLRAAEHQINLGAMKDAFVSAKKAVELAPENREANLLLGQMLCWSALYDDAIACAEKILNKDPDHGGASRIRGASYYMKGDVEKAKADLEKALSIDEQDGEAMLWLGEIARAENRFDEAIQQIDMGIINSGGYAIPGHVLRLLTILKSQKQDQGYLARDAYEELLHIVAPTLPDPDIANTCEGRPTEVENLMLHAFSTFHGNRTHHATYIREDDPERTLHGLLVQPHSRFASRYTQELIRTRSQDEVFAVFENKLQQYPDQPTVYCHIGELHLWLGDYEKALEAFEASLAITPKVRWAYIGLCASQLMLGEYDKALQACEKGIRVFPPAGRTIYIYRGETYRRMGERDKALADLKENENITPGRVSGWMNTAALLAEMGDPSLLASTFHRVRRRAPGLVHDAISDMNSSFDPYAPDEDGVMALFERIFTMMRGNRSSDFITYFTESGQLRFIPPPDIPDEVRNQ